MAVVSSKKRPATARRDWEHLPKKLKSTSGFETKELQSSKLKAPKQKTVKRAQPVTRTAIHESEEEDDSEEDEWSADNESAEGMDPDDTNGENITVKAKSSRESHVEQRAIHMHRKASKPNADVLASAKRIWSSVRQKDTPKDERRKNVQLLMSTVQGKVQDMVFKHDASRIVQSLVKYGGQEERDTVALELKSRYKELAQSKYSKFLVTKLVRYSPKNRDDILAEFQGHTLRLLLHREASRVISDAFELYASSAGRTRLVQDFYGREVALFEDKSGSPKSLKEVLHGVDEPRRRRVLDAVKQSLSTIFNNPDKGAITLAIVHRALWEYLVEIQQLPQEEEENRRREVFESCHELLAEMVHTKDGSRVVRHFIARGNAKDRKAIIKSLKPHIEAMCPVDEAQLVLFTALDAIDDTKLLAKSFIPSMTATLPALLKSTCTPASRRSILYLLTPRSPRHFTPSIVSTISETDELRDKTSKKDIETRRDEVRRAASTDLLQFLEKDDNGKVAIMHPGLSLVVLEIMLYAEGDKTKVIQQLLSIFSTELLPQQPNPIGLSHVSRLFKTLLQGGHFSHSLKSVEPSPHFSAIDFACSFVNVLGQDQIIGMAKGTGSFVVIELLQCIIREGEGRTERQLLKSWFNKQLCQEIQESEVKGRDILLDKITRLSNL